MSDFKFYVAEHNIPEEEWPEAFARWIAEQTGGPAPRFERVEPGDEHVLDEPEQRELDALQLLRAALGLLTADARRMIDRRALHHPTPCGTGDDHARRLQR